MATYAQKTKNILTDLKFKLDGEELDPNGTPEMLDLEGGETIDVYGIALPKSKKKSPKTRRGRSKKTEPNTAKNNYMIVIDDTNF